MNEQINKQTKLERERKKKKSKLIRPEKAPLGSVDRCMSVKNLFIQNKTEKKMKTVLKVTKQKRTRQVKD